MKKQYLFLSLFVLSLLSTSTFAQDHKMWIGVDLGFNSHKVGGADNTSQFSTAPTFLFFQFQWNTFDRMVFLTGQLILVCSACTQLVIRTSNRVVLRV